MSDDHDNDGGEEHERHHKRMTDITNTSMQKVMEGMFEQMAPMMSGIAFFSDEAKAWDAYVCAFLRSLPVAQVPAVQLAIDAADRILVARRERFNEEKAAERLRVVMPSARGLCNKVILRDDGSDSGYRCTQNIGHKSICF